MWNRQQALEEQSYWSDSRVINGLQTKHTCFVPGSHTVIDMGWVWQQYMQKMEYEFPNESTQEHEIRYLKFLSSLGVSSETPFVRAISRYQECYQCGGKGTTVNPAIDSGGLSMRDFDDPDFMESYYSGRYDVVCSCCNGSGEEQILEYDTEYQLYNWCNEILNELRDAEASYAAEIAAERRFGC